MSNKLARWRDIIKLAWPLIIANSFWNLQLTIDRMFLGQLSTEALGAAMAVMGVFWVPMALLQQTANYVLTFVAQYTGAKEFDKIGACLWQALYVSIFGGILFFIQNIFSPGFFSLVGHETSIQQLEVEYFNALAFSALPTALVAAISGFFTGLGRTQIVIGINFVGLALNAFLDYLLIFGNWGAPKLGIAGAGYATALATYGAGAYGFWLLFRRDNEQKYQFWRSWRPQLNLMKQFLRYGLPSGFQWALEGLAFTAFLILMGHLTDGEAALASSSIAVTIMMLSVLPSMGVAQAVMTLVGQNLGDRRPKEAEVATWDGIQISAIYMALVALTFIFFPQFYLSWFSNESNPVLWQQVVETVPKLLLIVALFTMFDSAYLNISFALKGAGDTRFVSLVALITPWPLMVLPAVLVRHQPNAVVWAWLFVALYSLCTTATLLFRFKQGKWKAMSVI